jgi:hypothetical protein
VYPFLSGLGLKVVDPSGAAESTGELCDGTLTVAVTGKSIVAQYESVGGCHDGAEIEAEVMLEAPGVEPVSYRFSDRREPRGAVEFCSEASQAPFNLVEWREGLFQAMIHLFGPAAYGPALIHMGWAPSDERLGTWIVPDQAENPSDEERSYAVDYTMRAVRDKSKVVRHRALVIMKALTNEADAERVVPAFLEAFKRHPLDRSFWLDMNRIMKQLTGESYSDPDDWYEWWQKQN